MKGRAPPPPQAPQPAPRHIFRNTAPDREGKSGVDSKENMLRPTVDLQLTLPQGNQISVTEDGSKALMDLLVELCSRYHLNPALHTLELLSAEGHPLGFKPNVLLGSLNVACVLIKEKVFEDKVVRRPAPKVPEKTVRLMVNYHNSQKAVVRVNPFLPLQALIPNICEKCDFDSGHVLLLKDSISRHELPLDKSLTHLGLKELYVHDQRLVLQPKMASAPALNYSDTVRSSTATLGRPEKKGLLSFFQFSRRKSKTESTSMDMDDCDEKLIQNTDTQSMCLSTVSGVPTLEDRPSTLGQSQSVMTLPRMSPKAENKKRRAPAPPGAVVQTSCEGYQIGLNSESQQRKRRAPVPPPTPASITTGSDDASLSAPTPDSPGTQTPIQAFHTSVAESLPVSSIIVVTQTINPVSLKTEVQPPAVCHATTSASSPTPSSSTTDSLALHDSSSELSHSLDDSDVDLDQAGSHSNTITSSTGSESQPSVKVSRMEGMEKSSSKAAKFNPETTSASSYRSDTESALNMKLDEVENNRHSAMAWIHSMQTSESTGQKEAPETPEEETVSLGNSSSGSSLPDQAYAASEGILDGEDSGVVSSPSDTQPTSPEGSLSLDGGRGGRGGSGERQLGPVRDNSSDSDEGCATWGSGQRSGDVSSQPKASTFKANCEDARVTAQLHETVSEAGVADHVHIISVRRTPYTMSTDSNEVPVSVVDIDVPVTAIDDVLEEYEHNVAETETSVARTESSNSKGPDFFHQHSMELKNKNNNAYTVSESNKTCSADIKQLSQPEQHKTSMKSDELHDKKKEKVTQAQVKEISVSDTRGKRDKQKAAPAVKSNGAMPNQSESTPLRPEPVKSNTQPFQERKPDPPAAAQRAASTEREETHRGVLNNSNSSSTAHGKITCVSSRFGMKTFTVVPPKPSVAHSGAGEQTGSLTAGAIKIDDQGNMVKAGFFRSRADNSLKSEFNGKEETLLLGKAKAFWNSQENAVPHSKGPVDRAKENTENLKSPPTAEYTFKMSNTDKRKTETVRPEKIFKQEAEEPVKDIQVAKEKEAEVESKVSVSKNIQLPSNKPALPPPLLQDFKRDLSFLKPSRRTSSQYVASAITRYAPKTLVKPDSVASIPESPVSVKAHAVTSMQVNQHQSSQSPLSNSKKTDLVSKPNPPGPKRSMSYPEFMSESQRDSGEGRLDREEFGVGSTKSSSDVLEPPKNNHMQSGSPIKIKVTTNNDNIKHIRSIGPTPAQSSLLHSSAKLHTTTKTVPRSQTSDMDMTQTDTTPASDVKPLPSVTEPDSAAIPPPVTVFGPIKKFRPVICGPIAKETSLHSSLMEAIQTGHGRDGLKKISNSGPSHTKKASYVEEQNERSALMSAIRAQSNTGRLRKTKSEAADELEKFRKAAHEEERIADTPASSTPPPPTSPTVFIPLASLPPTPFGAPPPPPPPPPPGLPKGKPSTVTHHPSANAPMNPASAREAMLEAIRSGSAAERLKKVTLPTKTMQVNGRLRSIQSNSAAHPQQ
ncbi:protein cordon-bleu isoform X2 [Betta splendens]|nr:protein cordon-bleu isoform X2 [Betta splendens]